MAKMWAGRTAGRVNETADAFNSSIAFDQRLYAQDIKGSMAHAALGGLPVGQGRMAGGDVRVRTDGRRPVAKTAAAT